MSKLTMQYATVRDHIANWAGRGRHTLVEPDVDLSRTDVITVEHANGLLALYPACEGPEGRLALAMSTPPDWDPLG